MTIRLVLAVFAEVVVLGVTGADEPTAHARESPVTPTVAAAATADGTARLRRRIGWERGRGSAIVVGSTARRRPTPIVTTIVIGIGGGRYRGGRHRRGRLRGLGRRRRLARLGGARNR